MLKNKFSAYLKPGHLILFLLIWLFVGFSFGTPILVGPVHWFTDYARARSWNPVVEDWSVRLIILIFIISTFYLSLILTRMFFRSRPILLKFSILGFPLIFASGALALWFSPDMMQQILPTSEQKVAQFTFGPYPTLERLQELKAEGYTAVISLLHPAVVPFEPKLIADEKENARKVGIKLIHLPMLPWISDNKAVLDSIRAIALKGTGKYYVHCYLGIDRVNLVRRVIEEISQSREIPITTNLPQQRSIKDYPIWERGTAIELYPKIFLSPYPTPEEFLAFVVNGSFRTVINLMDSTNQEDVPWIEAERKLLGKFDILFYNLPISYINYDPYQVLTVARQIWKFPKPILIHGFLTRGPRYEAFLQAFRSLKPPAPPVFFEQPLANGRAEVIAPNIVVGPRPNGPEFGGILFRFGIRKYIYVGNPRSTEARMDRQITTFARLDWKTVLPDKFSTIIDQLEKGGPYYIYGELSDKQITRLKERFGPAIPDTLQYQPERIPAEILSSENVPPGNSLNLYEKTIQFFKAALPNFRIIVLVGPFLLLYTLICASWVGKLRVKKNIATPYTRKIFHFSIFTMAGFLQIIGGLPIVVLFGSIVSLIVLIAVAVGDNFPFYEALARPTDAPHRTLFIIIPLITTALGGVAANLFFAPFAHIGYLIAGWGDALAEPVGARWGKHKYQVPSLAGVKATRSLEGSSAVLISSFLITFATLYLTQFSPLLALKAALFSAVAATVVEAFSNHGIDNFTIQITGAGVVYWLLA